MLILFSTVVYVRNFAKERFFKNEIFLLVPAIYFLIYLNFFYSTQIGVRHIMIILPLLYVFARALLQSFGAPPWKWILRGLLVWQLISVGRYFPHFLPYTNELVVNKKLAYRKLADTNLCYGEGGLFLEAYLSKHPEAKYLPDSIASGTILMEVNEMLNIDVATMGCYDWVRGLEPVGHIHSQYLIFNISPGMADSIRRQKFPSP